MNLFDLAASVPWAITEPWLVTLLEIANHERSDHAVARARRDERTEALATQAGRPLDNTRSVTMRDGVAILSITGPIFRRASLFSDISGATSVDALAQDFHRALNDPGVRAILLNVDSPGGEVAGINEFAAMIADARGRKPITAYVGALGCSAAYWLASAADEIVCDATALLGSIGIIQTMRDPSVNKVRDLEFVSSRAPNKRADPTTEKGRALIQGQIDALEDVFVSTVARNRGVSPDTVLSDFGQGGVLVGAAAVAAGLADRLGSYEATLATLAAPRPRPLSPRPGAFGLASTGDDMDWKTFFGGLFAAADAAEQAATAAAPETPATPEAPAAPEAQAPAAAAPAATAELEQLRAELAAMKDAQAKAQVDQIATAAQTWVDGEIRAGRAVPAEATAMVALYTEAAPAPTVLAAVKASYAARPATDRTRELLGTLPADAAALANPTTSAATGEQAPSAERIATLQKMTPLGEQALAAKQ